jgi:hypothetical protein
MFVSCDLGCEATWSCKCLLEFQRNVSPSLERRDLILRMEAIHSSGLLVNMYKTTQCHNPEVHKWRLHYENLRSLSIILLQVTELALHVNSHVLPSGVIGSGGDMFLFQTTRTLQVVKILIKVSLLSAVNPWYNMPHYTTNLEIPWLRSCPSFLSHIFHVLKISLHVLVML